MKSVGVLQIVDCLSAAGKERVAVNLANLMQGNGNRSYLCTTRMDGVLEPQIHKNVGRLRLARKKRYEIGALFKLVSFVQEHEIRILHAHDSSLFIAALASLFPPFPAVVWHDHDGRFVMDGRSAWPYRIGAIRLKGVIAVTEPLAEWARAKMHMPPERVWYLPNFVSTSEATVEAVNNLPGVKEMRIVCVAALRPQKDHVTLFHAMALVVQKVPQAHLLVVGGARGDQKYLDLIQETIVRLKLDQHVSLLGERKDVNAILRSCSVGVLSSAGEAFPLSLLEYGLAGLPAVSTKVGQCAEILNEGQAGLLVDQGSPDQLAEALMGLLKSPERQSTLGNELRQRVEALYGSKRALEEMGKVYESALGNA